MPRYTTPFLSGLFAASFIGATLLAAKPASADQNLLRDIGIGAATGVVTGTITNDDSALGNAANGAAAGAAVNVTRDAWGNNPGQQNLPRDAGVGAAASTVTGVITNRDNPVSNAVNGAAAGTVIHLLDH